MVQNNCVSIGETRFGADARGDVGDGLAARHCHGWVMQPDSVGGVSLLGGRMEPSSRMVIVRGT